MSDHTGHKGVRVLYVTTRQWNPGDEFILRGCRRILRACGVREDVASIYNKSPQTTSLLESWNFWKRPYLTSLASSVDFALNVTHYDNSLKRHDDLDFYDAVVFAGSPAWYGGRLKPLYKRLAEYRGRILYLGIGSANKPLRLSTLEKRVLRKALVSCRNVELAERLQAMSIPAVHLPCPALLSAPVEKNIADEIRTVGLGFVTTDTHRHQRISDQKFAAQMEIFAYLDAHYECKVIVHYIDELAAASRYFDKDKLVYRYDARDYVDAYSACDFVVSSRVHGCGISSSLGIPNAAVVHDKRGGTVDGFLSEKVDCVEKVKDVLFRTSQDLSERSEALKTHKSKTFEQYLALLEPLFGKANNADAPLRLVAARRHGS